MRVQKSFYWSDLVSGIVVFVVALPLCLGIAQGSGVSSLSGLIAGIVGGIAVGMASRSHTSVSGPAAGLITIVAGIILQIPLPAFFLAVCIAGLLQIVLGYLKGGVIANFVPSSVIKGMMAAIGVTLILKQLPHLVGYDKDYEGDEDFLQEDGQNTFSEILESVFSITPGAAVVGILGIILLFLISAKFIKNPVFSPYFSLVPLMVVVIGIVLNLIWQGMHSNWFIDSKEHMVNLPVFNKLSEIGKQIQFPDFAAILQPKVWIAAVQIAIVASLESLLSIEAADKLDKYKRITPLNAELKAQGIGNFISGAIGGLPVTSVVVRTSANINSGAKTKYSAIFHGLLLFAAILLFPTIINLIPKAALAAILIFTGFKLTDLGIFKNMWKQGKTQFIPFVITLLAILFTNLLLGVLIGILVGLSFTIIDNYQNSISITNIEDKYLIKFSNSIGFLNKSKLRTILSQLPDNSRVLIDGSKTRFMDHDILEEIIGFVDSANLRGIQVELQKSNNAKIPLFKLNK